MFSELQKISIPVNQSFSITKDSICEYHLRLEEKILKIYLEVIFPIDEDKPVWVVGGKVSLSKIDEYNNIEDEFIIEKFKLSALQSKEIGSWEKTFEKFGQVNINDTISFEKIKPFGNDPLLILNACKNVMNLKSRYCKGTIHS